MIPSFLAAPRSPALRSPRRDDRVAPALDKGRKNEPFEQRVSSFGTTGPGRSSPERRFDRKR